MPELPEVETIVRGLRTHIVGKKILRTELIGSPTFRQKVPAFLPLIKNVTVESITRHGKSIFLNLASAKGDRQRLHIHLGMTGQLLWKEKAAKVDSHTHVIFHLDDAQYELRYRDIRRFGQLHLDPDVKKFLSIPDAWIATNEQLIDALRGRNTYMKHALLNQKYVVGLGNIYVDESLFMTKIHPKRKMNSLNEKKLAALCDSIKKVLARSIGVGGTSFSNYVDMHGGRGGFKRRLLVYGKEGEPCPHCQSKIRKMVFAGRGTHYCPTCQK